MLAPKSYWTAKISQTCMLEKADEEINYVMIT